jgi:hypothetical protein
VAERVRVRAISNQEGNRLLRTVGRSSGSVVTWRRAQMVLLSAQGMDIAEIARVTFTSPDRVRDVIHNFNLDGFDSLYPRYRGGRPPTFTLAQRRAIKQLALSRPQDHDLPTRPTTGPFRPNRAGSKVAVVSPPPWLSDRIAGNVIAAFGWCGFRHQPPTTGRPRASLALPQTTGPRITRR